MKLDKMKITCHCGGNTKKIDTTFKGIHVRAWKCLRCKERIIHPVDAQRALEILRANKNKELKVKVRKVGKSMTLTIPHSLIEVFKVGKGAMAKWEVSSVYGKKKFEIELN